MNLKDQLLFDSNSKAEHNAITASLFKVNRSVDQNGNQVMLRPRDAKGAYGISFHDIGGRNINNQVMIYDESNPQQRNAVSRLANDRLGNFAMDDTFAYSVPSNGVDPIINTIFSNRVFMQLLQPTISRRVSHEYQLGVWETESVRIPTVSYDGHSEIYADYGSGGMSTINSNWVARDTLRMMTTVSYGELEIQMYGQAKIDAIGQKREGMAERIKLEQDKVWFFGYAGKQVYGLLNAPELANKLATSPNGVSGFSYWSTKTYLEMVSDVIALQAKIQVSTMSRADCYRDKFYLMVPPCNMAYFATPGPFGFPSLKTYLLETYPGMEIVGAQFLQGTGSPIGSSTPNYMAIIYEEVGGQECALNVFQQLLKAFPVIPRETYWNQVFSWTISGFYGSQSSGIYLMMGV
jgi:hypothetical protein